MAVAALLLLTQYPGAVQPQTTAAGPGMADAAAGAPVSTGSDLALQALALLGTPYRFGGQDPVRGFDCSGLVRYVAQAVFGLDLPRSAEGIARVGQSVARDAVQMGDLLFFNTSGRRNSHVGIYIGEGRFVHAPARKGEVRVEEVGAAYWIQRFNGARRLPMATDSAGRPVYESQRSSESSGQQRDPDIGPPGPSGSAAPDPGA